MPRFQALQGVRSPDASKMVNYELLREGGWNKEEVVKWLSPWESVAILRIPIPLRPCEDKRASHFTKHGHFSVRSAYFLELNEKSSEKATSSEDRTKRVWKLLWKTKVRTKIRNFGWRALHQGLPMRENLYRRGCAVERVCLMCGDVPQTILHSLAFCHDVRQMWRASPLRFDVREKEDESLMDWVLNLRLNHDKEE